MHSSRMRTVRSLLYRLGLCPGELLYKGVSVQGGGSLSGSPLSPPPRGQTDACENITLPPNSVCGR